MRRCRGAGLAGLAALLLVAAARAQVQQDPLAETTEGTSISINCSHANIQTNEVIHWYRQLPGGGPTFLVSGHKESKELRDPPGRLSVAADRRSSALWLARPRRGDSAVYYCALRSPYVPEKQGVESSSEENGKAVKGCFSLEKVPDRLGASTTSRKTVPEFEPQCVYLEYSKTFDCLSQTSFMTTLVTNGFSKRMIRATEHSQPGRETASGAGTGLSPGAELASEERRGGGGEEVPRLEQ
ncbi:uncharacterized protein LOC132319414 [Gavia stellata]|uniref:uncharacterized protein LOC132319414 n=1 Tax=Gavia stellata TaxID=37040 RepID=UPI00289E1CF0|nr:uncharacterized protein LOC132319414 [Gavia stellata]